VPPTFESLWLRQEPFTFSSISSKVFLLLALSMPLAALAQLDQKSPTGLFLAKRGYKFPGIKRDSKDSIQWPDTLYYNTTYKTKLLGSPTIPITFGRIEYIEGKYQATPTFSVGYGYTWFFGRFIFSENDRLIVEPTIFFGLVADIGVQSDFNIFKPAGIFTGAFIGTQTISFFFGYDYVTHSPTVGIGSRIDVYTFSQKSLRPIGNVRELRKHKKRALPIMDE